MKVCVINAFEIQNFDI